MSALAKQNNFAEDGHSVGRKWTESSLIKIIVAGKTGLVGGGHLYCGQQSAGPAAQFGVTFYDGLLSDFLSRRHSRGAVATRESFVCFRF